MSLLDRLVPASALRWGNLTKPWPMEWIEDRWGLTAGLGVDAVVVGPELRRYFRPDPAAAWGEADRRAEDR